MLVAYETPANKVGTFVLNNSSNVTVNTGNGEPLDKPRAKLLGTTTPQHVMAEHGRDAVDVQHHANAREFAPVPAAEALAKAHAGAAETLVRGDYLRLWPHRHATDGFFAAVWERR